MSTDASGDRHTLTVPTAGGRDGGAARSIVRMIA